VVAAAILEVRAGRPGVGPRRWAGPRTRDGRTIADIANCRASSSGAATGVEGHLDAYTVYNPPNLPNTYTGVHLRGVRGPVPRSSVALRRFTSSVDDFWSGSTR